VLLTAAESRPWLDDAAVYLEHVRARLDAVLEGRVMISTWTLARPAGEGIIRVLYGPAGAAESDETAFDLAVLATHGRSGFRRWLLGSVAEYVLARTPVPTLVTRPRD
jgi:nucleotide-binding universal stress UspA family protein